MKYADPPRTPDQHGGAAVEPAQDVVLSPGELRFLWRQAGISIWMWRHTDDRVFHAGATASASANPGMTSRRVLSRLHPNDRRRVRLRLEAAARAGGKGTVRFRSAPRGGASDTYEATYFAVATDRLRIVVRNITRQARAEKALHESREHYRAAIELNPEIPWLADANGRIIEVGPRWLQLVGMTEQEALGDGWASALHPEDTVTTISTWRHAILTGAPVDVEYRVRTRGGEYRWMRARAAARRDRRGRVVNWYGTLEDVHERRLAVAALRESEEFARSILESSAIAIEVLDTAGRLIFMNGPGIEIMEVADYRGTLGRLYEEVWPEETRPVIRGGIARALKGEMVRQTLFGPTAAGSPRWWDLSLSPIRDGDGQVSRVLALSRDVTEARKNEAEVASLARRLANVLESTMDSVITVDPDWRITFANRRAATTFGDRVLTPGQDLRELLGSVRTAGFLTRLRQAMVEQKAIAFEEHLPSAAAWLEVQAHGSALGLTIFFRDVTERRRAQEQIVHLAQHDTLTGLANRMHFSERLLESLAALAPGSCLAVMTIDLDDFKLVNDTLGHPAGDILLREIAARLLAGSGMAGVAARLGGDEFALMMPAENAARIATMAQAVLDTLSMPTTIDSEPVQVSASIGIAVAPRDGVDGESLLQDADVALYQVKAGGGRAYRFYEPQMDQRIRERRELKRELGLALARNELYLAYQPQIEISSLAVTGFEALLRWRHPTRGEVSPAEFIPLAEESGVIDQIGVFVLETACQEAVHWPSNISIAVNLSPVQFRRGTVVQSVKEALTRSGLPPSRLELEITESVLLDENTGGLAALEDLHRMGIRVALDDFGTGYSSLSYLRRFPFDKIKIDRSFVSDLPRGEGSVAIVRSIIGLGRSLRTRVTAEGVESWEQQLFLRHEGCNEAQGYLFSRPLPAAEARRLAAERQLKPEMTIPGISSRRTGSGSA